MPLAVIECSSCGKTFQADVPDNPRSYEYNLYLDGSLKRNLILHHIEKPGRGRHDHCSVTLKDGRTGDISVSTYFTIYKAPPAY